MNGEYKRIWKKTHGLLQSTTPSFTWKDRKTKNNSTRIARCEPGTFHITAAPDCILINYDGGM
jgi:hypothetical protein